MRPPNPTPEALRTYLESHEVELIACPPEEPGYPHVTIPTPAGWTPVPNEVFPHAYAVLVAPEHTEDGWTPNAVLLHGRLSRWRPTDELLRAAASECRSLPEWSEQQSDSGDFDSHRSVVTRGIYRVGDAWFDATTRFLVVDAEYDRYLTQLTVTTRAHPDAGLASAASTIHNGLTVVLDIPARADR
ncbi:LpqN/LpqT family lipoprotein [Rhodococcus artemisiae]|uniref:LpqN/LpqT family lipoprotein n=1 Tax=Rhodococcus artemisiae TaxID=714159 RepID=A0ABU7L5I1_9NOCA|nr:LpqN/LpqT family lipoprotein [Rhodococcus artemisiae]MEE2056801.1 LpqN/LpqT family lipoprotein [Rhodococcus artemisiae]